MKRTTMHLFFSKVEIKKPISNPVFKPLRNYPIAYRDRVRHTILIFFLLSLRQRARFARGEGKVKFSYRAKVCELGGRWYESGIFLDLPKNRDLVF